jgi:diketogulonate reductase-like aldo/keto reductase
MITNMAYGTYRLKGLECEELVFKAIQCGYRTIDTAELYKNHVDVGNAIRRAISEDIIKRCDICVISKVHDKHQKTSKVYESCQNILNELNIGYIDIILLHNPIEKVMMSAYGELVKAQTNGICLNIGVSNFAIKHLEMLKSNGIIPYMNQVEISVFNQRSDLVNYCNQHNITIQAHSVLTNGKCFDNSTLCEIAQRINVSVQTIMLTWCRSTKLNIVINSSNVEHMTQNLLFYTSVDILDLDNMQCLNNGFCIYKASKQDH